MKKLLLLSLIIITSLHAGKNQEAEQKKVSFKEMLRLRLEEKMFRGALSISDALLEARNLAEDTSYSDLTKSTLRRAYIEKMQRDAAKLDKNLKTYHHLFKHMKKTYRQLD